MELYLLTPQVQTSWRRTSRHDGFDWLLMSFRLRGVQIHLIIVVYLKRLLSIYMKYIITLIFVLIQSIQAHASDKPIASSQCAESFSKNKLIGGWYLWQPYQFNKITASGYNLTGMDIDLVRSIAKRVGVEITYEQVDWKI